MSAHPPSPTRAYFASTCASLLNPLLPFFSPGRTRLKLGATATRYDEPAAQLEGFSRSMWGVASLVSGTTSSSDSDDHDGFKAMDYWLTGLRNGTNPSHPEFWGWPLDRDQRMVEMCPLGYALCIARPQLWDPLTTQEKKNVAAWFTSINGKEMPQTNWLWFRVWANLGIRECGGEGWSQGMIEKDLEVLDGFYRGEGWSNDGPEGYTQMDYYSGSFAIQLLQLLYVRVSKGRDGEREERYRGQAREFARGFVGYWDEVEGRGMTFGRSLTYRFAMAGFWSAVALAEVDLSAVGLSGGVVKGLLLRNLRWWMERKEGMLTVQGTLNIGYCYPNQFMSENYNSPGSPYWFMLGFVALGLKDDHPFWQCEEEPLPVSKLPSVVALKHPLHITVRKGGHTFLLSSGQQCHYPMRAAESKYGKFAYSSAFGYSVPVGGYWVQAIGGDNMLALSDDDGETWKVRRVAIDARIEEYEGKPVLVSGWKPWGDVSIETYLLPPEDVSPNWHLRIHHIKTSRHLISSEGAFALLGEGKLNGGRELEALQKGSNEGRSEEMDQALAVSQAGAVGIVELKALGKRKGVVLDEDANSNLVASRSCLPTLASSFEADSDFWVATAVFAIPSSAHQWQDKWTAGWNEKPSIPKWLEDRLESS